MRDLSRGERAVQRADVLRRLRSRKARQHRLVRQGDVLPLDREARLAQHRRSASTISPGISHANNYQSGSNYRIVHDLARSSRTGDIYPVIGANSYVYYTPIDTLSQGSDARRRSRPTSTTRGASATGSRSTSACGTTRTTPQNSRGRRDRGRQRLEPPPRGGVGRHGERQGQGRRELRPLRRRHPGRPDRQRLERRPALDLLLVLRRPGCDADQLRSERERRLHPPPAGTPLVTRAQALQQVFNWFFAQGLPQPPDLQAPSDVRRMSRGSAPRSRAR